MKTGRYGHSKVGDLSFRFCLPFLLSALSALYAQNADAVTEIYINQATGHNSGTTGGTLADPFKSITYAMNTMAGRGAADPWTVHIAAGTYDADPMKMPADREVFPIELRSGMVLTGDNGPDGVVLSGLFNIDSAVSLLHAQDATDIIIRTLTLTNMNKSAGYYTGGAAAQLINCTGLMEGCLSLDNKVSNNYPPGGAIWLSVNSGGTFNFQRNTFQHNSVDGQGPGGAISVSGAFSGNIEDNTFFGNQVSLYFGGAISIETEFSGTLKRNVFVENSAPNPNWGDCGRGAAVFVGGNASALIEGNCFSSNYAGREGAGLFVEGVFHGQVCGNTLSRNAGGGGIMFLGPAGQAANVVVSENFFLANQVNGSKGAGFWSNQNVLFLNNTVVDGAAGKSAVHIQGTASVSQLHNNIFSGVDTAISEETALNLPIKNNDFSNVTNILDRAGTLMGNDIAQIAATLSGFRDNQDLAPGFQNLGVVSGTWTSGSDFDAQTHRTTMTDSNANWLPGQLKGCFLDVTGNQGDFPILENTITTITVQGNIRITGYVDSGDAYAVYSYRLASSSQNVNAGIFSPLLSETDFEGDPRICGWGVDIGADEYYLAPPPSPVIYTNGGVDYAIPGPETVTLEGSCDLEAIDLRVNDLSFGVTYTPGGIVWSYSGLLSPGPNVFSVVSYNMIGEPSEPALITITLDTVSPTVTISSTATSSTNLSPIPVSIAFSEPITGLGLEDLVCANGAASNLQGAGLNYTFNLTPVAQGLVTVNVPANAAQDAAGNPSIAAAQFSRTYDSIAPTVILTSTASDPTAVSPVPVSVTFSEAVTGFTSSDISLTNGSLVNLSGGGANYTFDLVPAANGTVRAFIPASSAQDAAGNRNAGSNLFSRVYMPAWLTWADIPDVITGEDTPFPDALHLPGYCSAYEGDVESFAYSIVSVSDENAGVNLNGNNNLDIDPAANWHGSAVVTVSVSNGVLSADTTFTVIVNSVNDVPTDPGVSITPTEPLDTETLTCTISTPSTDPDIATDGQSIAYAYAWYVSTNLSQAIGVENTLSALLTQPGVTYVCVVTPNDGVENGPSGQASVLVRSASSITAAISPADAPLGHSLTISGDLSVAANTNVSFASTSPLGAVLDDFPYAVPVVGTHYSRTFYPTAAGAWQTVASWPGDGTYRGASSSPAAFSVSKVQPSLDVTLSASAVPVGFAELEATITASAPLPDSLKDAPNELLKDLAVDLYLRNPEGSTVGPVSAITNALGVATVTAQDFADAGVVFDAPGTWRFLAELPETDNFLQAFSLGYDEPSAPRLTVKDGAGYAIVVVGKLDQNGEGLPEHTKTAEYVYRAFIERGFADEDIYYMSALPPADVDIVVDDDSPSEADVNYAITQWARDKMNASPGPLYVVLIDHGNAEQFFVYSGGYGPERVLTPPELDGYFDTLESSLIVPAGEDVPPLVLVYGACNSGSFIEQISGPGRVVIASASADELSHRGVSDPSDPSDVRDGEPFVTEFFRGLRGGKTLKESFEVASQRLEELTLVEANAGGGAPETPQHPVLDDNGDGVGHWREALRYEPEEDGGLSHTLELGFGANAGPGVGWVEASRTQYLAEGAPVELFARATDVRDIHTAWIEVKTPAYAGGDAAATGTSEGGENLEDFQQVVVLPQFEYDTIENGVYRWNNFGALFDLPGTYQVFYYIRDGETGETSMHLLTTVYRQAPGNLPPPAVTLTYPADTAVIPLSQYFSWEPVLDPEGGPVTYRIELATDPAFSENLMTIEGLIEPFVLVEGLTDQLTYYWRVIPVDEYGASPSANAVWTVHCDQANPAVPGALTGYVTNALTGAAVTGAAVSLNTAGFATETTEAGRYFLAGMAQGGYILTVTAPGYEGMNVAGLEVTSGICITQNLLLQPADTTPPVAVCQAVSVALGADGTASITAQQVDNGSMDDRSIASMALSHSAFSCANLGPNTVTLTVTDTGGNTGTCEATVTVSDPDGRCDGDMDNDGMDDAWETLHGVTDPMVDSDADGLTNLQEFQHATIPNDADSDDDAYNDGVEVAAGSDPNNVSSIPPDVTDPTAVCQAVSVALGADGTAQITAQQVDNGSTDDRGIASLALSQSAFTCANLGVNTVTLTVTDTSGNTGTCEATVSVSDPDGRCIAEGENEGPVSTLVPDVLGMPWANAETAILHAGLTVGIVSEAYNATLPAGVVFGQSPSPGVSVSPGSAVDLVVSKGPQGFGNEGEVTEGEGEGSGSNKLLGCGAGERLDENNSANTILLLSVLVFLALGIRMHRSAGK